MTERECLKGWITTPSPTDGTDVPFFINVRDKDILWDESNLPKELLNIADKGTNIQALYPAYQLKFNMKNWVVTLNKDFTYTANIKVNVADSFYEEDNNTIRANIDLPIEILNDDNYTIQCTRISDVYEIINSDITVLPDTSDSISDIEISIDNRSDDNVFIGFSSNTRFNNSFISISLTGKVKL